MTTITTPSIAQKLALTVIITLFSYVSASATNIENEPKVTTEPIHTIVYQSIIARVTDKSVFIDWNTAVEGQNNHFEIERSTDMNKFSIVAIVLDGFSTQGTGKRYAFKEDVSAIKNSPATYYRLKQLDGMGNISYSQIIKVQPNN